jgi:hypothetical protein
MLYVLVPWQQPNSTGLVVQHGHFPISYYDDVSYGACDDASCDGASHPPNERGLPYLASTRYLASRP